MSKTFTIIVLKFYFNYYSVFIFVKRFIEERARNDLRLLTNVGPRVSGSRATDIEEVSIFISILYDIRQKKSEQYSLEYEESTPSGVFYMDDDEGHTSSYSKVNWVLNCV